MEDNEIIIELGGPTNVAKLLGLDKSRGGVQRVQNWLKRGIPPKVKLARPDLFLRNFSVRSPEDSDPESISRNDACDKKNYDDVYELADPSRENQSALDIPQAEIIRDRGARHIPTAQDIDKLK